MHADVLAVPNVHGRGVRQRRGVGRARMHMNMAHSSTSNAMGLSSRASGTPVSRRPAGQLNKTAWAAGGHTQIYRKCRLDEQVRHAFLPSDTGVPDDGDGKIEKSSLDSDLFWLDDDQDEYDEDGYLINRASKTTYRQDSSSEESDEQVTEQLAQQSGPPSSASDGSGPRETTLNDDTGAPSRPSIDRSRIISEVDLFREKELLFQNSGPEYNDSYREREKKRSLSAFRGGLGGFIDVEEMNRSLTPDHLERHRFVLAPDEAFGAIFMWEVIVEGWRELEMEAWNVVAEEEKLYPVDMEDVIRAEDMIPEQAVQRVFHWSSEWGEIKKLIFRQREVLNERLAEYDGFRVRDGVVNWLEALSKHGTRICLCGPLTRQRMDAILEKLDLRRHFSYLVTADQEFESLEQMCLLAALSFERPPQKCAVFTDQPKGVIAAHEISMKAVALVKSYKAFELRGADVTIGSFDDLVVLNVRRLFGELGYERMDVQTQTEVQRLTMEK